MNRAGIQAVYRTSLILARVVGVSLAIYPVRLEVGDRKVTGR